MSGSMNRFYRVRVKFCGMTSKEDALQAAYLGVDAIGLIFHKPSPRNISIDHASTIACSLPPFVTRVGVFVNESVDFVQSVLKKIPLDILQFHGQESTGYCRSFKKPYIKTIHIKSKSESLEKLYPDALAFLFDTYVEGLPGGSGFSFNWEHIPGNLKKPFLLAGGLNKNNIIQALEKVKPYAVDVTSGIEKAKGEKDFEKMKEFLELVRDG